MVASDFPSGSPGSVGERSAPARRIAGAFLRAAMGPVDYAGSCILGNKILTGLEELSPDGLIGAYRRGVGDVAALAGVPKSDVESILPLGEIAALEERLRQSQPRALAAWRQHAGQFGFLDVVTALTIDGRKPDIGLCIERVAGKVRQDLHLAEPLDALGTDIAAWQDLVVRTRHILEDRGWLARALRRRVLKRVVFGGVALIILISVTVAIVTLRLARDGIEQRLASLEACDAETLSDADLKWSTAAQREAVQNKVAACKQSRADEAARIREEEAVAEAKHREQAIVEARQQACASLADEVEKGALSDAGRATAGKSADFLARVAKQTLDDLDAGPSEPVFPCADHPSAAKRLEKTFGAALLVDPLLWARRADPSAKTAALLIEQKAVLPERGVIGLADNAERTAKTGLARGDKDKIAAAKRLCALAKALGVAGHPGCNAIQNLP